MTDTDIDSFIRQQKAKLANEREVLNNSDKMTSSAYRRKWRDQHLAPAAPRKQWGQPVKLSPRGDLDTDALIADVEKERQAEEYKQKWRQMHGGQEPSPRGLVNGHGPREEGLNIAPPKMNRGSPDFRSPRSKNKEQDEYKRRWRQRHPEDQGFAPARNMNNNMARPGGALDTDAIIREVEREKQEEENRLARNGPQKNASPRGAPPVNKDAYRRMWEEQNAKQSQISDPRKLDTFDNSHRNIETSIADARREADNYRQRWEQQHTQDVKQGDPESIIQEIPLPIGEHEKISKKLKEERTKEFHEYMRQKHVDGNKRPRSVKSFQEIPMLLGGHEEYRKQLNEQRRNEYRDMLRHKQREQVSTRERYGLPEEYDEAEDFGLFAHLGETDKKLKEQKHENPPNQLNLLGKNIYDPTIRRGYQGRPLREQTDEYKAALGANESDTAKIQKIRERNNEYNQFLANKRDKEDKRFADKKQGGDGVYNTIPGLRYSNSAQKRREMEQERNKEYNEMLRNKAGPGTRNRKINDAPPVAPKQGWGTPTYEEMLDKKRTQESNYRRANDIGYETDVHARDDARAPPLDLGAPPARRGNNPNDGSYFASLPLGANPEAEKMRRQEEYKRELQKQMAESAYARKTEREQGLLINNNAIAQPDTGRGYERRRDRNVDAYHTKILDDLKRLDDISPRSNAILGRRQPTADRRNAGGLNLGGNNDLAVPPQKMAARSGNVGLLDMGFDTVIDQPRLSGLEPPAGLQYQPSQETARARY